MCGVVRRAVRSQVLSGKSDQDCRRPYGFNGDGFALDCTCALQSRANASLAKMPTTAITLMTPACNTKPPIELKRARGARQPCHCSGVPQALPCEGQKVTTPVRSSCEPISPANHPQILRADLIAVLLRPYEPAWSDDTELEMREYARAGIADCRYDVDARHRRPGKAKISAVPVNAHDCGH